MGENMVSHMKGIGTNSRLFWETIIDYVLSNSLKPVNYGDIIQLEDSQKGLLGVYHKGSIYLVVGKGSKPKSYAEVGDHTKWQIMKSTSSPGSGPLKYENSFYLKNADFNKWLSDDKRSGCFDGADGYFGLATKASCANAFKFTGRSGFIQVGDNNLTLACATEKWKCLGKPLTIYPFNEAHYLVWDSQKYPQPSFKIKRSSIQLRPFHNIAHMCNTPDYVDKALKDGANAIECDIQVKKKEDGTLDFRVHHGWVAFYDKRSKASTPLHKYLTYLKKNRHRFTVIVFDCKKPGKGIDNRTYGKKLCEIIKQYLPPEQCVMSIPYVNMVSFFDGMKDAGFSEAGKDISMIDISPGGKDAKLWIKTAESKGANWLGMGVDAYAPASPLRNWIEPLKCAVQGRDKNKKVKKVYYWTLNSESSMRRVLATNVDGLIVNDPKKLKTILEGEFRATFRLAKK